ncbi:YcxB family protein [Sphingomonas sp. M1A8_2b]
MADGFVFKPTVEDYIAVSRGSFLRALRRRQFKLWVICVPLVAGMVGVAIDIGDSGRVSIPAFLYGVGAGILWLTAVWTAIFALAPRRARRLFHQQRSLDRTFSLAWTDERLTFKSDTSMSDMPWSDYHGWFETRDIFAFGLNEQMYHFAPKRAMSTAMIDDLRRAAQAIRSV